MNDLLARAQLTGLSLLYIPSSGDIVYFDWTGDVHTEHVGIVEKAENVTVYIQNVAVLGKRILHILSTEQVNALLKSIDRKNPIEKRNYAVLVMVACLGMKAATLPI